MPGRALAVLAALVSVVLPAAPAVAKDDLKDQVVITGRADVPRGTSAGDVVIFDGPADIGGRVEGDLVALNGPVRISGAVTGDVLAVTDRVVLAPGASVGGDISYVDKRPVIPAGATVGGDVTKENFGETASDQFGLVSQLVLWLLMTVSGLILGLLLIWLAPRAAEAAYVAFKDATGAVVGWGLGLFFLLPIAAIILLVTVVAIPLGLGVLLVLLPLGALGYVTGAYILGRLLLKQASPLVAFLAGFAILRVLALIPWGGGVLWFMATAVGLGALAVSMWRARRGPVAAAAA